MSEPAADLPLPDPPLSDGVVRLRPWHPDDASALAAAWADPEIQRWTAVPPPERCSVDDARRWISGEAARRQHGFALDLVVLPADPGDDTVLGEVGLVPRSGGLVIGWWVAAPVRRTGVATRAVTLLARWAEQELSVQVVAEVDPANEASLRVARRAGIPCL